LPVLLPVLLPAPVLLPGVALPFPPVSQSDAASGFHWKEEQVTY
jgi:hypothetical protein